MQWEYFDRMVLFSETPEGMVSGLETWINGAGADRCRFNLRQTFSRLVKFREEE